MQNIPESVAKFKMSSQNNGKFKKDVDGEGPCIDFIVNSLTLNSL